VKVLDFGLAKMFVEEGSEKDLSQVPRITIEGTIDRTREGLVAGTATYMSPEQARGNPVDKRTDIWAFACVLYEMLTARPAFPGETVSDTIAAILERDADWGVLPAQTPVSIRRLLQRCLEKDPKRRLRDIGDARLEIEEALGVIASGGAAAPERATPRRPNAPARPGRLAWWTAAGTSSIVPRKPAPMAS
jgi:serine/threonine protein kinase